MTLYICLLCFGPCLADTVVLKNGGRFTGKVVRDDGERVALQVLPSGILTFRRDEIARIEYKEIEEGAPADIKTGATLEGKPGAAQRAVSAKGKPEYPTPPPVQAPERIFYEKEAGVEESIQELMQGIGVAVPLTALLIGLAVNIAIYVFFCYCLKRICEKAGTEPGFLIWIPLLQTFPLLKAAGMSYWMFLLLLIPLVNIVISVIMWVRICKARGKSPWLVLLMFIPLINIIFFLYLAFSE